MKSNCFWASLHFKKLKRMSYDLAALGTIAFVMSPWAVELSVVTGVFGWLWPISASVTRKGAAALQL